MPPTSKPTNYRKFYYALGIELKQGDQLIGDCPFPDCNATEHLFVSPKTGMWDCKKCGESGNHWTFIRKFHEAALSTTTSNNLKQLENNRQIKSQTLEWCRLALNPLNGEWLIPIYRLSNRSNSKTDRSKSASDSQIMNLYHAAKDKDGKFRLLSLPAPCKQLVYTLNPIQSTTTTVWVLEGHWDAMVWLEVLGCLRPRPGSPGRFKLRATPSYDESPLLTTNAIWGLPGATTFPTEDLKMLGGMDVKLILDNDQAGTKGMDRVPALLEKNKIQVSSLQKINWKETDPNDIRDLLAT